MEEIGSSWLPSAPEIAELFSLVEREHSARQESREAVYDRTLKERVASGLAVEGLRFEGEVREGKETALVFNAERNDSRFRPGTRLRLSRGDPRKAVARLELLSDRFDGKLYRFRLSGAVEDPRALDTAESWVLDEDLFDLLETQVALLRAAEKVGLSGWLAGSEPSAREKQGPVRSAFMEGLEGTMRKAFEGAVSARNWFAVQGPPGTGKTHLLARLALHYAVEENARVMVGAVSHQAIHNALGEAYCVGRRMQPIPGLQDLLADGFYKLGASRGHNEGLPEGVRAVARLSLKRRPVIVGATVYAAAHLAGGLSSKKAPYDAALFDEAGQATLVLALGARLLGEKAVFIGDDAQLPPIVELPSEEERDPRAKASVMAHLRQRYGEPLMLAESRRLNAGLCAVVSDCFYGGRLGSTPEAAARALKLAKRPRPEFEAILDPEKPFVFLDVPHEDCRSSSEREALWAAAIVLEAVRCGVPAQEVGVIAPYRAQCNRIRFLLDNPRVGRSQDLGGGTSSGYPSVVCSTVERFQGQEREMVVISLTSSKPAYLWRLAGFLFDPNRLNVALSRARTKAVLIGSRKALSGAAESAEADSPQAAGFQAFLKLLSRAHGVDGRKGPPQATSSAAGEEPALPLGAACFEPGEAVEHAKYGAGMVLTKSIQVFDGVSEWVNEVRFADGRTRLVIPRLSETPMKRLS
ncbi:MAG: AAA family ATPase [Elusimicrobia bacterium]|nr:AAA family ATPase [Elusimicrobiota bacterium]